MLESLEEIRSTLQARLETLPQQTLKALRDDLRCRVSPGVLSRILRGDGASSRSWRDVGHALGIEIDPPSIQRRADLRRRCREHGLTLEDAAAAHLRTLKGGDACD